MPRTRDLFLFGIIVLFLVSAIGLTWWQQMSEQVQSTATVWLGLSVSEEEEAVNSTAVLINGQADARAGRLIAMRERVADQLGVVIAVPETVQTPPTPEGDTATTDDESSTEVNQSVLSTGGVQRCTSYTPSQVPWSAQGILFQESEGVRVVFRIIESQVDSVMEPDSRVVLAQLPIRQFPLPTTQCLSTDVVGIAQDGSLIRNNEFALYGIFGPETIVGFALDGFPIHGTNQAVTVDVCGGAVVGGQYRYYLDASRSGILNCFAGIPVIL